ncbi:MAG TPA: Rab family GTPase [Candidatus Lokiarchaeia archaeon]|nr:Rab family GTPase [Candidatus Lokiarchaeia archaeon]
MQRYKLKIVIIGEHASGKTSLINKFVKQTFNTDYRPTIGTNILLKKIDLDGDEVTLTCWDIAGQERWSSMRQLYYKGSSGAFIVGDLTRKSTFDAIVNFWAPDLRKYAPGNIPIVVLANKCDLEREATTEDVEDCANQIGAISSLETSALNGDNVDEAFMMLAKSVIKKPE